ncbi:GTP-binding protein [Variovorax sp. J22G21]|uniref:CobW family GTP-binding protein n=1 Tax=Variovorax fucosicus TaxID=3053517 RepID=UPI002577BCAA|nr:MULTISPECIES: GTP-binding protein [unclassified Variovorax]MDM0039805.1 GTP-binding protein [Variovorax sp. J22R193]MDM0064646.1 GTP-binding protein [Variovorax sp. J22G21]
MTGHFSSLLGADQPGHARVPVTVLTGFLGSGKTTLLNELLREPDLHGTAVIVNEFGEVGIDHDLIANTTEDTILLANGCMCCAVRGDLIGALASLGERAASDGSALRQVLIETSGLADPAPILRTLMGEPAVKDRFTLAGVCCTVDAVLAPRTLDRHPEAARQIAMADHLFLTKTDLLGEPVSQALLDCLRGLNPTATVHQQREAHAAVLRQTMETRANDARPVPAESGPFYRPMPVTGDAGEPPPHSGGITSFVIVRDDPLPRDGFYAWLDMVIAMRGEDLLRVKGIVNLAEQPEQPLVFHGVQHLYQPPVSLPAWPSLDRRTRIVFITRGVDAEALDESLRVFERRRRQRPPAASSPDTSFKPKETP